MMPIDNISHSGVFELDMSDVFPNTTDHDPFETYPAWFDDVSGIINSIDLSNAERAFGNQSLQFDRGIDEDDGEHFINFVEGEFLAVYIIKVGREKKDSRIIGIGREHDSGFCVFREEGPHAIVDGIGERETLLPIIICTHAHRVLSQILCMPNGIFELPVKREAPVLPSNGVHSFGEPYAPLSPGREGYCHKLKVDASTTYALVLSVLFRRVAPWGDYCEQVDGYYDLDAFYVWLRCSAVDMDIDFNYDHDLWYVARYIGAHDPPKVCSVAVQGVHGDPSTFIMFFGGIGINTVSIDGIVVDTVSNNLRFAHDVLALSGVLPHASITPCLARSTGSFLHTVHHGKYEQDVTKAGPPYLCKSTPDDVDAIVVADDEASNLIGNVALNTAHASGILTHQFIMPNQVDVTRFRVSTSIDPAYRSSDNMITTTAVVAPDTTEANQPKTLRALVEPPRGHRVCTMQHIPAGTYVFSH
jgi:hypothetical protein